MPFSARNLVFAIATPSGPVPDPDQNDKGWEFVIRCDPKSVPVGEACISGTVPPTTQLEVHGAGLKDSDNLAALRLLMKQLLSLSDKEADNFAAQAVKNHAG
jgi:hypothetical protein